MLGSIPESLCQLGPCRKNVFLYQEICENLYMQLCGNLFTYRYIQGLKQKRFKNQTDPLPMNVTLSKGSVHIAVQRGFVNFVLHKSAPFLKWLLRTTFPDETFFSSLNNSPHLGVPGAYTGKYSVQLNRSHIFLSATHHSTHIYKHVFTHTHIHVVSFVGLLEEYGSRVLNT